MSVDCGYDQYVLLDDDCSNVGYIKTNTPIYKKEKNRKKYDDYFDINDEKYRYMNEESFEIGSSDDLKCKGNNVCSNIIWGLAVFGCNVYVSTKVLYYMLKK